MGAVTDRLDLTVSDVKDYLKVSGNAEDSVIEILLESAKEAADEYLNNPFTASSGEDLPIPNAVSLWCLQWCGRNYTRRSLGITSEDVDDLGQIDWGDPDHKPIVRFRIVPGFGP